MRGRRGEARHHTGEGLPQGVNIDTVGEERPAKEERETFEEQVEAEDVSGVVWVMAVCVHDAVVLRDL